MPTRDGLIRLVKDLTVALERHHTGASTLAPFARTYEDDAELLRRARINIEGAEKPENMYRQALMAVQVGACNASGLINSLSEWLGQIWADVDQHGGGTAGFNRHPVIVLIVSQLAYLAGLTLGFDTSEAEARAEELAAEFDAARKEGA